MDLDRVAARVEELAKTYGLQVDPNSYVWQLAVGEQQRVEIVKALYRDVALLILDEPTAVLTPQEVDDLFVTLRLCLHDYLLPICLAEFGAERYILCACPWVIFKRDP